MTSAAMKISLPNTGPTMKLGTSSSALNALRHNIKTNDKVSG